MHWFVYELNTENAPLFKPSEKDVLEIRTCQRSLVISPRAMENVPTKRAFEGARAYEFLLRFASGLESEIKGETDVFGQVKTAIKNFNPIENEQNSVQALFAKIFQDTKEIRAQYLHGIGGNTYGALARRVLSPTPSMKVLILGAGQISKSVAPYFAESELTVFNRSNHRLIELELELRKKGYTKLTFTSDESKLSSLIAKADLILIATPPQSELDNEVLDHAKPDAKLLHLGGQNTDLAPFKTVRPDALTLSDLFSLEQEQSEFRQKQIHQAEDACRERALLRSLARSIHIPHGWEDLAVFETQARHL